MSCQQSYPVMTIYKHLSYLQKARFLPRQVQATPRPHMKLAVIIPCYQEPDVTETLETLAACEVPAVGVEVILVVNASERDTSETQAINQQTLDQARNWSLQKAPFFDLHLIHAPKLPKKHAGVGLARKIGLDEAIDRFGQLDQTDGILVCLDADCKVAPNYLVEILHHFDTHPKSEAVSIWFEHPLSGTAFSPKAYEAVAHFELSLRYYIQALRYAGYPYAVHAVGSTLAFRAAAYQKYGGMNRRQGAEDFHFLHKFTPQGQVHELHTTSVYPQPRPSQRAPLGTGQAIRNWIQRDQTAFYTYDLAIFQVLKLWLKEVPTYMAPEQSLPSIHPHLQAFLQAEGFFDALADMRKHATHEATFRKRFFAWLDPLKVKRCIHYLRDQRFPNQDLLAVSEALYRTNHDYLDESEDVFAWLQYYRRWEKYQVAPPSVK